MTFTPAVIFGGLGGFRVFEATAPRQRDAFEQNPTTQRALDYFRENISNARTAQDLVADRRLLEVSLAAYGLSEEIDKRAFIRRILEDGVDDPRALARFLQPRDHLVDDVLVDREHHSDAAIEGSRHLLGLDRSLLLEERHQAG